MSGLSFNEVMQYAGSNYYNGGDVISERWDQKQPVQEVAGREICYFV